MIIEFISDSTNTDLKINHARIRVVDWEYHCGLNFEYFDRKYHNWGDHVSIIYDKILEHLRIIVVTEDINEAAKIIVLEYLRWLYTRNRVHFTYVDSNENFDDEINDILADPKMYEFYAVYNTRKINKNKFPTMWMISTVHVFGPDYVQYYTTSEAKQKLKNKNLFMSMFKYLLKITKSPMPNPLKPCKI